MTFRLAYAGAIAIPLLVFGAVVMRSPVFADDASADSAAAVDSGNAGRPASSSSARPSRMGNSLASALAPLVSPGSAAVDVSRPVAAEADVRAAVEELRKNLRFNNLTGALAALKALMAIDPDPVNDARPEIVDLTQRVMGLKGPEPAEVFDLLVNKMGTGGLDVLYEMVTTKGGSDAAVEAKQLLDRPDVLALASPAMRVAYQLRNASLSSGCDVIKALFPEIRAHGDGRSLGQLYLLGKRCGRRHVGPCCLENDPELDETVKALQAKGFQ